MNSKCAEISSDRRGEVLVKHCSTERDEDVSRDLDIEENKSQLQLTKTCSSTGTVGSNETQSQKNEQDVVFVHSKCDLNVQEVEPSIPQCVKLIRSEGKEHSPVIVTDRQSSCEEMETSSYCTEEMVVKRENINVEAESSITPSIPLSSGVQDNFQISFSSENVRTSSCDGLKNLFSEPCSSATVNSLCSGRNSSSCIGPAICTETNSEESESNLMTSASASAFTVTSSSKEPVSEFLSVTSASPMVTATSVLDGAAFDSQQSDTAGHLLSIAKKFIEENGLVKTMSSTEDPAHCVIMTDTDREKHCPDSVITMYLSSPNELKDQLEKLKTGSPVIVMQAGDDVLRGNREPTERALSPGASEELLETELVLKQKQGNGGGHGSVVTPLSSLPSTPVIYHCVECGYSSHNKHYYKQHVDLVHNADRPYKCPHCDYAGKRRHALLEHMVVHSNQRPFTCEHCNASFRKKGHLTNHIKLHTSQRLIHCGVCNIQLPDTDAFEAHLRKIHNTDKLYKCKLCDHTVVNRGAMLNHLQTHDKGAVYSCSKCQGLFNDESSLDFHFKNCRESVVGESSHKVPEKITGATSAESRPQSEPANIMCSECGFVCSKEAAMKKHMWTHIKKETVDTNIPLDKGNDNPDFNSSLGVLKLSMILGQKSLPDNTVYQCSSCNFNSSDNSLFIKHMLAHKTQRKQQNLVQPNSEKVGSVEILKSSVHKCQTEKEPIGENVSEVQKASSSKDDNIPFVYDKASARFRCIICGYHCEFQRTIKAHIWKHSGHQNIQYPVFETNTNREPAHGPSTVTVKERPGTKLEEGLHDKYDHDSSIQLSLLKTSINSCNPHKSLHVHDAKFTTIVADQSKIGTEGKAENQASVGKGNSRIPEESKMVISSSGQAVSRKDDLGGKEVKLTVPSFGAFENLKGEGEDKNCVVKDVKIEDCTEPGVVVEIVDSVPPCFGLTGMRSQQGSPRVLDLDGSGAEATLTKSLQARMCHNQRQQPDLNGSRKETSDTDMVTSFRKPPTKVVDVPSETIQPQPVRLRCPTCDRVLLGNDMLKSHLLMCQSAGTQESIAATTEEEAVVRNPSTSDEKSESDQEVEDTDNIQTEDSDDTESSDEQAASGDSGVSQQKTGICSSLLAVIEQLRERSRSESDDGKAVGLSSRSKKRGRQNTEINTLTADDFQNIEKISDNGSDKFRCSLCHYTSQRICNMKLHMKTHRQKKPSECSLCDFSSSSPEALQEHMLKHCKVRTYACKFCPQSFNHKSTLRAHLRAHKDHEPFLCAYCVYETTSPIEYREHMQVHSGCSSRLHCPLCNHIYNNKEELTTHLLKCKGSHKKVDKASNTGKLSKKEKESTEKLQDQTSVSLMPVHHTCVVSGCSFSSSNLKELQDHLSVHCNPSLLMCNLCDFKALHSRSLKSHMKRHANDQRYVQQPLEQYKCNLCGYVCHHLPSLKSHMWRHASDQNYSYEFTNDVINAAIDHDTRVDSDSVEVDDPELLDRVINSERKILEGELTKCSKGDGQRPICWVTFRCCSCGFETINKPKLNIHMRSHSDIIQQALELPKKSGNPSKSVNFTTKQREKRTVAVSQSDMSVPIKKVKSYKFM